MKMIVRCFKDFLHNEKGATMVEYGIIVALIAAVSVATVSTIGTDISGAFNKVKSAIETAGLTTTP